MRIESWKWKERKKKLLKILSAPANDKYFIADVKFHAEHFIFPSMFAALRSHSAACSSRLFRMSIE